MANQFSTSTFKQLFKQAFHVTLNEVQLQSVVLLIKEMEYQKVRKLTQCAYVLGTAWHECRFLSVREKRASNKTEYSRKIRKMQDKYWNTNFYGRGFPQLTWEKNYKKFIPVINKDLVQYPDLVLIPEVGAKILVFGMVNGSFTARANSLYSIHNLNTYFPDNTPERWTEARRIVNGNFQAEMVAADAIKILGILVNMDFEI